MNEITMKMNADKLILMALQEDITSEDVTTNAIMPEKVLGEVDLICKGEGVIAGLAVFARTFELLDKDTKITFMAKDGDKVKKEIYLQNKRRYQSIIVSRASSIELFTANEWNCYIYKSSSKSIDR